MIRRLGPLALVALQGWGCGETRLLDGFSEGLTRLRLAPSEFVGSVPCQKATPGALQTYVARIQEVTVTGADAGSATPFTSGPVPCDQAVVMPATPGRRYAAEVYGFDDSLAPAERTPENARWTASCGRGSGAGDAGLDPYRPTFVNYRGVTAPMRGCTSFFGGGSGAAQLVVDQLGALGTRRCGLGAGEVSAFEATLDAVTRSAACGVPLVFDVAGVDRYHSIELIAFEANVDAGVPADAAAPGPDAGSGAAPDASIDGGDPLDAGLAPAPVPSAEAGGPSDSGRPPAPPVLGEPRWRTRCIGRALPGVAAPAFCEPLVPLP